MPSIVFVRIWILISALATTAGWLLSAIGQLNRVGYLVFFAMTFAAALLAKKFLGFSILESNLGYRDVLKRSFQRAKQRFTRPLPCLFLLLAVLAFLGGAFYPPSNHTAMSYRTPRVLQWLAQGEWYWIHTANYRMNNRACGIEWLTAPLILFTKSDRGIFLLNFFPFLLLPGLMFSVFTRLGVRGRVAWPWMWLLPTGYTFLLQAGSAGNDAFPTIYGLAAVDFACRAWTSRRPTDLMYSIFSAALLVGAKASNLPLLLPWGILMLLLLPIAKRHPVLTVTCGLVAMLVSFLPTATLNYHYLHDWSGLKLERPGMDVKNPLVGLWGNPLLFLLHNFVPPFFPPAGWWNHSALSVLPRLIVDPLANNFEDGFHLIGEMPTEDWSGIGFGISALVLISIIASRSPQKFPNRSPSDTLPIFARQLVLIAPWIALAAYCLKSGMVTGARLITPYYPLLLPLLIISKGHSKLVRQRWWKVLALLVSFVALSVLIVTPGRPLWPAQTILSKLVTSHPSSRVLNRALDVYTVYGKRWDPLAPLRSFLPADIHSIGWLADGDDIDVSLWRPFGSRRVEHFLIEDPLNRFREHNVQYVVINADHYPKSALSDWITRTRAETIGSSVITLRISSGPQEWKVFKIPPPDSQG